MNFRIQKYEPLLYGLVLLLALLVRIANLGAIPLSDYEAGWALQSLDSLHSQQVLVGPQPAYVQITTLLFFVFGQGNLIARLFPALLGSLVVIVPLFFRNRLGQIPALILALALAIDPGLVGLSRQIGTPVVALAAGVLAWGLWRWSKPELAGITLGLALMGGESFWLGLAGWGVAMLLARRGGWFRQEDSDETLPSVSRDRYLRLGIYAGGTLLVVGGLFFLRLRGLNGIVAGFSAFLQGWIKPADVSLFNLLAALPVYQPGAVVFGLIGAVRGWQTRSGIDRFLSVWALAAFILAVIYPAHQVGDLLWVVLPLWALAVREITRYLPGSEIPMLPAIGQAVLTVVILLFSSLQLAALTNNSTPVETQQIHALSIAGALVFLALTTFLIIWGWSSSIAVRGLVWGLSCFLLLYTITMMTGAAALRPEPTAELWDRDARVTQGTLLINSLNDLSQWHTGFTDTLDVVVSGIKSPGLRWALRYYPKTQFVDRLAVGLNPSVVITAQDQPDLAAAYRGQNLVWSQVPEWSLMLPAEYLPWLVYHTAPVRKTTLFLWVRTDIFPGGSFAIPDATAP